MGKIYQLIFLVIVVMTVVILVRSFVVNHINVNAAESSIIIERMINSERCFAYSDSKMDRAYPGIIDLAKFKEEQLEACLFFEYGERDRAFVAAQAKLRYENNKMEEKTIYLQHQWFKMYEPISGFEGPSGTSSTYQKRFVLVAGVEKHEKPVPGLLEIKVLKPNE